MRPATRNILLGLILAPVAGCTRDDPAKPATPAASSTPALSSAPAPPTPGTRPRVSPGVPRPSSPARLSREVTFLAGAPRALPPRTGLTEIAVEAVKGPFFFNGAEREAVREVTISGLDVVLDPLDEESRAARFVGAEDLGALTVLAERLIVRGPVRLPQTEVTVYARELVFEDADPEHPASIDTTPLDLRPAAPQSPSDLSTPGADGRAGHDGGDITLVIQEVHAPGETKRLILEGGRGQDPGDGRPGAPGKDVWSETFKGHRVTRVNPRTVNDKQESFTGVTYLRNYFFRVAILEEKPPAAKGQSVDWVMKHCVPGNGGPGIPGGHPGSGGRGGTLRSTVAEAEPVADVAGGAPGSPSKAYPGGRAGKPARWQHLKIERWLGLNPRPEATVMRNGTASAGKAAPARTGKEGERGAFERLGAQSWLRALTLQAGVDWIRGAYLAGGTDQAREACDEYLLALDQPRAVDPGEEALFLQLEDQLVSLKHRLVHRLDYFGNPPGWVPMLSFEANYATFERESEVATRLLYLSHLLELQWREEEKRRGMIDWASGQMRAEIESAVEAFGSARDLLPALRHDLAQIDQDTKEYLVWLDAEEKLILERFQGDKEAEKAGKAVVQALRTVCEIGAFVALGAATGGTGALVGGAVLAAGAGVVSGVEAGTAKTEYPRQSSVTDLFKRFLDEEEVNKARERFAALDPAAAKQSQDFLEELRQLSHTLGKATRAMVEEEVKHKLAEFETGSEFERYLFDEDDEGLRTINANFREMFDRLVVVMTQKQLFEQKLAEAVHAMQDATDRVAEATLALDRLRAARQAGSLDPVTLRSIREMRRLARERLLRYQYYLARSYEYRMLEPCPVDFRRNELFDVLVRLFGLDGRPPHKPSELAPPDAGPELASYLKAQAELPPFGAESRLVDYLQLVYVQDLREVVGLTIQGLNERRAEPLRSETILVLDDAEIGLLNSNGVVTIDLDDRVIFSTDVNCRLENVRVLEGETKVTVSGPETALARLEISCEPAGRTLLAWKGELYEFVYGRSAETSLVRWGCTWDTRTREFSHFEPSDDTRSLLAQLVDPKLGEKDGARRIHFRPGARSKLVIRKEVDANAPGVELRIDQLAVRLEIHKNKDFKRRG